MDGAFSMHRVMRNTYKILVVKLERNRRIEMFRRRWEDNI
jgi:hypothetical protein